jgi:hypothetical protein
VIEESEYSDFDEKPPMIDSHVSETRAFTTKESFGSVWKEHNTASKYENAVSRISFKNIPSAKKIMVLDIKEDVEEDEENQPEKKPTSKFGSSKKNVFNF